MVDVWRKALLVATIFSCLALNTCSAEGITTASPPTTEGITTASPPTTEGITTASPPTTEGITTASSTTTEGITTASSPTTEGITTASPPTTEGITTASSPTIEVITIASPPTTEGITTASSPTIEVITIASPPTTEGITTASSPTTEGITTASSPTTEGITTASSPTTDGITTASPPTTDGITTASSPTIEVITIASPPTTEGITTASSPTTDGITTASPPTTEGITTASSPTTDGITTASSSTTDGTTLDLSKASSSASSPEPFPRSSLISKGAPTTLPTETGPTDSLNSSRLLSVAAIAGLSAAAVVVLVIVASLVIYAKRKQARGGDDENLRIPQTSSHDNLHNVLERTTNSSDDTHDRSSQGIERRQTSGLELGDYRQVGPRDSADLGNSDYTIIQDDYTDPHGYENVARVEVLGSDQRDYVQLLPWVGSDSHDGGDVKGDFMLPGSSTRNGKKTEKDVVYENTGPVESPESECEGYSKLEPRDSVDSGADEYTRLRPEEGSESATYTQLETRQGVTLENQYTALVLMDAHQLGRDSNQPISNQGFGNTGQGENTDAAFATEENFDSVYEISN
ncbi:hypothetical protein BaRGS_00040424 [Batillaria attramentaria]|uniref:Uncharacterized protein n=1 Tax=Batillaria attramentaria TaxID=370345 RepID=A0ABD0J064_9CAEN